MEQTLQQKKQRAVAIWLLIGVAMIIIQVLLGGVTRLTGSGLSITKWNPIFGMLPPLNQQQWDDAFKSYQEIGQYKYVNSYYTLQDFKYIFFWEWLHRVWARMLGVVFAIGFVYFLVRQYFDKQMIKPLIMLFVLGGLQGVVGILMVFSGVNPEDVHVNYMWLAAHFVSAMVLACYTLWFALILLIPKTHQINSKPQKSLTIGVLLLLFLQLTYGAFMAGLKAAQSAATWPTINGDWLPKTLGQFGWVTDANLNGLMINIHFVHRGIAYLLLALIIYWFVRSKALFRNTGLPKYYIWPMLLVAIQVILGIATVLLSSSIVKGHFGGFEFIAEAHQLVAMFLLMSLIVNLYLYNTRVQKG